MSEMTREEALDSLIRNVVTFESLPAKFKKDREFVLAAVESNGYALKYAYDTFKKDREIVMEAVQQNGYSLQYASKKLQNDPELKKLPL